MNKNMLNWGYITWTLFHTLIAKLNDTQYNIIGPIVLNTIKGICSILPCPVCKEHAVNYVKKVTIKQHLPTKEHMKQFFYHFHNNVNIKNKKAIYPYEDMNKYNNGNLKIIYNNFRILLNKNYGNPRMMENNIKKQYIFKQINSIIEKYY